ncbi:hypothetical protein BGZ59_011690 [Podila verticillata]|nr:hypothetical protein BGZ59_011690 [Podila verticillata]
MSNPESSFRNAFKNFGARSGVSAGASGVSNTSRSTTSGFGGRASNWFGGVQNQVSGYVPVSLGGSQQPVEESWLDLTWFQRMAGFSICIAGGLACFMIAFFVGIPLIVGRPSKFAVSFTLGSLLWMASFAILRGPMTHLRALVSKERILFTITYFGSMAFVLVASLYLRSQLLTLVGTVIEGFAFLWYFASYSPFSGGSIRLGTQIGSLLPAQFYKSLVDGRYYSYDQIPDLTGKVALITGANQRLGYDTTLALVAHGAHAVVACRTEAKANEAIERLHKDVTETYPHSVAAAQIAKGDRLKLEFLDGIAGDVWTLSADGIENHFAVNHLGHFSLAYETLPPGGFNLATINDETVGDPLSRYGHSKYANILFGKALASRLENEQVFVNIVHPGVIKTNMGNTHANDMEPSICTEIMKNFASAGAISVEDGTLTQLYCATSPEVQNKNIRGKFFIPIAHELDPMPEVESKELQEQLWT